MSAGTLRAEIVSAVSPYVRDVVVCGINESFIALLVWPNIDICAKLLDKEDPESVGVYSIVSSEIVREKINEGLQRYNSDNPASSKRIGRYLCLTEEPDPGAYEITDKGYINQGEVQRRRAHEVSRLFASVPDLDVEQLS